MKQVPESVDLAAVFAEHKFGGLRIRPVRMVPAMTGQLTHEPDGNIGMKMVWTLMIEERIHSRHERAFYHEVVTLVAEADAGLPKLLRDVADLIERGPTKVQGSEA